MKKIMCSLAFLSLLFIPVLSLSMDNKSDTLLKDACLKDLENHIINNSVESLPLPQDTVLTVKQREYIQARKRGKIDALSHDSVKYVYYKDKIACFDNSSIHILYLNGTKKRLISDIKNSSIKSVCFNKRGDQIAAIDSSRLYVWSLWGGEFIEPFCSYSNALEKEEENATHTNTCVALNDGGNRAAVAMQTTLINTYQNQPYTYHTIAIVNTMKNTVCYKIDLKTFYPEELYFLDDSRLAYAHKKDDIKIIALDEGQKVINELSRDQKNFLYCVYKYIIENRKKDQQAGVWRAGIEKMRISQNDPHHDLFRTLPETVQGWVEKGACIEGFSKEECIIC